MGGTGGLGRVEATCAFDVQRVAVSTTAGELDVSVDRALSPARGRRSVSSRSWDEAAYWEEPLFAFVFWSFAFMCELCTILPLLANISHDRIYQPC